MPYVDDDEPPGAGFHGARPGVSVADLAFDEPGAAADWGGSPQGAAGFGGDDAADGGGGFSLQPPEGWDEPPLWPVVDGTYFRLPAPVWGRWRGRPRLHRGLGTMLRGARRVGTLRHRRSGERLPVYRAAAGRKSWRVVGRPRGRNRELEIVALQPELEAPQSELAAEGELEAFPVDAFSRPARYGAVPRQGRRSRYGDVPRLRRPGFGGPRYGISRFAPRRGRGWRLRLPHRALHTVLSRLRPDQLRGLAGGDLPPDPAPAVMRAVAGLAQRARPAGRLSGGFTVFATPGWRLLVRPLGELQGEIVSVRPVEGEEEAASRRRRGLPRRGSRGRAARPPAFVPGGGGYAALSGRLWWRTADGADLTLAAGARPGFGQGAASGRAVRPWRMGERRRTAALERLLRTARRVGTLRSLTTGARYGVFRGRLGARAWDVVARPLRGGGGEIVAVRRAGTLALGRPSTREYGLRRELGAEEQGEMGFLRALALAPEQIHGQQMGWPRPGPVPTPAPPAPTPAKPVQVAFQWVVSCTLEAPYPNAGKGFYVIHNPKKVPVYGGKTNDFRQRMEQYKQYARIFERKPSDYGVLFAEASGLGDEQLERYVVRSLIHLAGGTTNIGLREPYVLSKSQVVVTHTGKNIPAFLKQNKDWKDKYGKKIQHRWDGKKAVTTISAGAEYELPQLAA